MRVFILFVLASSCCIHGIDGVIPGYLVRRKRDASGALDIVTNHAQPIHADVKNENAGMEKVIPPKDALYQGKSLRKSLPQTTSLDLIRAVNRLVTLVALIISATIEFYPLVQHLYFTVYEFMYPNKY